MSWNGTVRCSNCYDKGHNRNGCPKLKEEMQKRLEADPDDYRATSYFRNKKRTSRRTCGYCQESGHNRKTCKEVAADRDQFIQQNIDAREKAFDWLKSCGLGIGTLVKYEDYWNGNTVGLVQRVIWSKIIQKSVLIDEEGIGVPDTDCLVIAKLDGTTKRRGESIVNPRNAEILGTISGRLVSAQVPYAWLESKDEATLGAIGEELKSNNMNYVRRYLLKTEESPYSY